ncbi:MAG: hypothetical protein OdinLCB4_005330 [Candidatus Odinarchaeum yellowstonii]|uniref:Uncharacterized protein n=1 Tax=Odinarchaeota yellowstonii (strain LCB_4) TaxID=1841599 RepID=A0AAF0D1C0_ODILC|nr:MAG: hypothetical protein OdinLCB4_005330 [Candidatus Odinarchaeum yellowstonii]
MSNEEEKPVEALARLKSFLEDQIDELEEKLAEYKEFIKAIDLFLVKTSLKTADQLTKPGEAVTVRELKDNAGNVLGKLEVSENRIVFTPSSNIKISVKSPSLQSFFIPKVLEKYRVEDENSVKKKSLDAKSSFNYKIEEEDSNVKRILVENYREQPRLREIERALRWTVIKAIS